MCYNKLIDRMKILKTALFHDQEGRSIAIGESLFQSKGQAGRKKRRRIKVICLQMTGSGQRDQRTSYKTSTRHRPGK